MDTQSSLLSSPSSPAGDSPLSPAEIQTAQHPTDVRALPLAPRRELQREDLEGKRESPPTTLTRDEVGHGVGGHKQGLVHPQQLGSLFLQL